MAISINYGGHRISLGRCGLNSGDQIFQLSSTLCKIARAMEPLTKRYPMAKKVCKKYHLVNMIILAYFGCYQISVGWSILCMAQIFQLTSTLRKIACVMELQ